MFKKLLFIALLFISVGAMGQTDSTPTNATPKPITSYWNISGSDSSLYLYVNAKWVQIVGRNWLSHHSSGGTYTGSNGIVLTGTNFTLDTIIAATKAYVNNYLPLSGGTLRGEVNQVFTHNAPTSISAFNFTPIYFATNDGVNMKTLILHGTFNANGHINTSGTDLYVYANSVFNSDAIVNGALRTNVIKVLSDTTVTPHYIIGQDTAGHQIFKVWSTGQYEIGGTVSRDPTFKLHVTGSAQTTGLLNSLDHIAAGDSTKSPLIFVRGSSETVAIGRWQTYYVGQTWLWQTGVNIGYRSVNQGLSGRQLQQITVGDSSLYSTLSSIPKYTTGSLLLFDCIVNDYTRDTTVYTTSLWTTQATAIVNAAIAQGWPVARVGLINLNYSNYNIVANHGYQPYRHNIYNAAMVSVASATGCFMFDNYTHQKPNAATLIGTDSLHMTPAGNADAATQLTSYLNAHFSTHTNYTRNVVYGNSFINNDEYVAGTLRAQNIAATSITSGSQDITGRVNVRNVTNNAGSYSNVVVGSNISSSQNTNNVEKAGEIDANVYGDTTKLSNLLRYDNTSTNSELDFGISPNQLYGPTIQTWSTAPTITGTPVKRVFLYPNGGYQIGGTQSGSPPTETMYRYATASTATSGSSINSSFIPTITATVNGQTIIGTQFNPTFTLGGITGTVNISAQFLSPISLPNVTTPATLQNGLIWSNGNWLKYSSATTATRLALQTDVTASNNQVAVYNPSGFAVPSTTIPAASIPATTVTAGSYTSANITVGADGRITAAANGSGGGGSGTVTSITPGIAFVSHTPITTSGTMDVDTAAIHSTLQGQINTLATRVSSGGFTSTPNKVLISNGSNVKTVDTLSYYAATHTLASQAYNLGIGKYFVFCGDSYTAGTGAGDTSRCFAALTSHYEHLGYLNHGSPGSTVLSYVQSQIPTKTAGMYKLFLEFGINDVQGGSYTNTQFQTDYTTLVNYATSHGWSGSDIVFLNIPSTCLVSLSALTSKIVTFNTAIQNIATANGSTVIDLYTGLQSTTYGGINFLAFSDGVHANNLGHEAIKWQILTGLPKIFTLTNQAAAFGATVDMTSISMKNFTAANTLYPIGADALGVLHPISQLKDSTSTTGIFYLGGSLITKNAALPSGYDKVNDWVMNYNAKLWAVRNGFAASYTPQTSLGATQFDNAYTGTTGGYNFNINGTTMGGFTNTGVLFSNIGLSFPTIANSYLESSATGKGRLELFIAGQTSLINTFATGHIKNYTSTGTSSTSVQVTDLDPFGRLIMQQGGTYTTNPSARLQINSTVEGVLIPRMTTTQRNLIGSVLNPFSVGSSVGSSYTTAPTATFSAPNTSGGVQAIGTVTIGSGSVTGILMTNVGTGYTSPPTVTFSGGGGSGAVAVTTISLVDGLTIYNTDIASYQHWSALTSGWVTELNTANTYVASSDLTAQTAANTSVATYTTTANGSFRIGGYVNITAVTVDVIEMQVTYTDENNTSQTANFFTQGATSALLSAVGNSAFPTIDIRCKTGTAITVKTTLTTGTGSILYDVGATITKLR